MRKSLLEKYKRRLDQEQEDLRALMSRRGQDIRANDGEVPKDSTEQAANAYSKEFVFHQTGSERARLSLVNRALTRIESPEFGSCESCEKTIERKRLDAVPWARYCRVCQELEEELNSSATPCWLASFQPRDRESFKQRREAAGRLGPGQPHHLRSVLGAVAARQPGMQNRAVLASVEMTPVALGLMIVEPALGAALGTGPAHLFIVFDEDVDFPATVGPAQLHAFDSPGTFNA